MLVAKQLADLLTLSRGLIALLLIRLGLIQGEDVLPLAAFLLLAAWITDLLDGPLARYGHEGRPSWVGDHDIEIDVAVSLGLLVYMVAAGQLPWLYAAVYLVLSTLIFLRWGWRRELAMLFQAPIYLWFLVLATRHPTGVGWWLVGWILIALLLTWPRFPEEVIPAFLSGMKEVMREE